MHQLRIVGPDDEQMVDQWEAFWTLYPKKVAKSVALAAWSKVPAADRAAVLEAVIAWRKVWMSRDGEWWQYVPHASTFLNQRRWEDELPPPPNVKPLSAAQANDVTGIGSRDDYKRGEIPANVMAELQKLKRRG